MQKILYTACLLCLCTFVGYAQKKDKIAPPVKKELSIEDQRKFDYYFYEAMNAKATDKYDVAFDMIQYCHRIDSTNANILYEMGIYFGSMNKQSQAMNYYRKATVYDPDNIYYRMSYATICLQFKQYDDAIEQYEYAATLDPEKAEVYIYLAEAYRQNGDFASAIASLNKLEQNIGMNEQVSIQKFQLYTLLDQQQKGFSEIQKYIDKNPSNIKHRIFLGNLYLQSDKPKEALRVYAEAREIEPDNPYLISSMAEYYEHIGDKEAAENELKTAVLSPDMDVETKLGLLAQYIGTLQSNKKETEAANPLLKTLMEQHPQEPKLNLMYGNLLMIQEKKKEAYSQFEIFAEAHPTDPTGWEQMLSIAFPDSVKEAVSICKKAIEYNPDAPQFHLYLGLSQYLDKDYKNALLSLQEGVKHVEKGNVRLISEFYGQMGDLYYQINQVDSAFAIYEKALLYNPQNIGVLNNYSYYLSLLRRDLDKAEKMSSLTIKAEPSNPTYLDTYGWILFEQGAYAMAKIYIERAINYTEENKEPLSRDVLEHYGDVLFKIGEKDKALEYWIKAKKAEEETDPILNKKIDTQNYIEPDRTNIDDKKN